MPEYGGKKFPYTPAGQAAARRYRKKMQGGKPGGPKRGPGARPGGRPGMAGPSRRRRPARPMRKRGTRY